MNIEDIEKNFSLCIGYAQLHASEIGMTPLYAPFGGIGDGGLNPHKFGGREYCLAVGHEVGETDEPVVRILTGGIRYVQTYGYSAVDLEKWKKSYKFCDCPNYNHTFDDLPLAVKERLLLDWRSVKGEIEKRIGEMRELDHFEV